MGLTVCLRKRRVLISVPNYLIWGTIRWVKDSKAHVFTSHGKKKKCVSARKKHPKVAQSCMPSGSVGWVTLLRGPSEDGQSLSLPPGCAGHGHSALWDLISLLTCDVYAPLCIWLKVCNKHSTKVETQLLKNTSRFWLISLIVCVRGGGSSQWPRQWSNCYYKV